MTDENKKDGVSGSTNKYRLLVLEDIKADTYYYRRQNLIRYRISKNEDDLSGEEFMGKVTAVRDLRDKGAFRVNNDELRGSEYESYLEILQPEFEKIYKGIKDSMSEDELPELELKGLEEIAVKRPKELPKSTINKKLQEKFHFDDDGKGGYILRYDGVNKTVPFTANDDWTYVMQVLVYYFNNDPSCGWVHYRVICRHVFGKDYDSLLKKEQAGIRQTIKNTFSAIKLKKLKPSGLDKIIIIQSGEKKIGRLGGGWYRLELRLLKEASTTSTI